MRGEKNEKGAKNCSSSCWLTGYSHVPSVHNMVQSIRIDFVCCRELSLALYSCSWMEMWTLLYPQWGQTHTLQYISLPSPPAPSLSSQTSSHMSSCNVRSHQVLLHNPPQPPSPPSAPPQHHHINMHLLDKWSTLSMFSRQIRSHPLSASQPFDLSVCLLISQRLNRMPSVLGKL